MNWTLPADDKWTKRRVSQQLVFLEMKATEILVTVWLTFVRGYSNLYKILTWEKFLRIFLTVFVFSVFFFSFYLKQMLSTDV